MVIICVECTKITNFFRIYTCILCQADQSLSLSPADGAAAQQDALVSPAYIQNTTVLSQVKKEK